MPKKFSDISTQTRRNLIKRILKQAPQGGLTITEIFEIFSKEHGHETTRKTVERDLDYLSESQGVYVVDEKATVKCFAISEDYAEELEITITEEHLQIINLALGLLSKLGPVALSRLVSDTENSLVETLPEELKKDFENFKSLQAIQSSTAGKAILKDGDDLKNVLLALRKGKMIRGEYFSKHRGVSEERDLGPIFMELFGGSPYLLAEDIHDPENPIKRFKLSRLSDVSVEKKPYTPPEKSDCERFLSSFAGVGGDEAKIEHIQIWGSPKMAEHFEEIELHPSQKLTKLSEDEYLLEFRMPLAYHFIRYMAGFGGEIYQMDPSELFFKVRKIWTKGLESFGMEIRRQEKID